MVQLSPSSSPAHGVSRTTVASNGKINGKGKGKAANGATGSQAAEFAWEVCHAGLVGIEYKVAMRLDLFDDPMNGKEVLKGVVEAAVSG